MCGIAGIFSFQQQTIPQESLREMVSALSHRGPDDQGFFHGNQASIGHRRLSIIDLTQAASQPMCDESRRFAVLLNGEIYNFRELRKRLESSFTFFSHSDTEVILRLFQKEREKAWPLFNGMFAIAILDNHTNELFLARDHAGVKPLYYARDHEKFLFASEPQSLLKSGLVTTETDTEALNLYLQLGYFPAPYTPFQRIRKLPAGHCMKVSAGGLEILRYWELPETIEVSGQNPEALLEEFLLRAVERQMISDVPVGVFLSGGIDSSLIVALMSRISGSAVRTFTAGFEGFGYYDERPAAAKIAKLYNTQHHDFVVSEPLQTLVPRLSSIFGEPFADSSAVPTLGLAELTGKHVKVVLSGTGGDEIFGGYRKYMAAHWASAYASLPQQVRRTIRRTVGLLPASRQTLWQERALLLQRFADLHPESPQSLQLNSIHSAEEVKKLTGKDAFTIDRLFQPVSGTMVENMMLFDYEFYLPEDLLVKEDRATMAFGLEARVPYLDREIVEFMHRLPVRYKVSRAATKKLFRAVAKKYVPEWVLKKPKHGFGSPVAEWLRKDLKDMAAVAILSSTYFPDNSLLHTKWDEHQRGVSDHSRSLWAILMLELWNDWLFDRG